MDRQDSVSRHIPTRQLSIARQHTGDRQYSEESQYSPQRQPSKAPQLSIRRQHPMERQHPIDPRYALHYQNSTVYQPSGYRHHSSDSQYALQRQQSRTRQQPASREHSIDRQEPMSHPGSFTHQSTMDTHDTHSYHFHELTPLTRAPKRALKPHHALPYPIPPLRPYSRFNDPIYMYQIHIPRSAAIERLNTAAVSDAEVHDFFPDTGLVGTLDIDPSIYDTLIFAENLVDPVLRGATSIYASTFGIIGQELNGQWRVRCWIQPSGQIAREIQNMVRDAVLSMGQVVNKRDREGRGRYGPDAQVSVSDHEWIWNCIREWDGEMRALWIDRFQ